VIGRGGTITFFALSLLLIEAGLGTWIFRASNQPERIVAGLLMVVALVLVTAMGLLLEKIRQAQPIASQPPPEFRKLDNEGIAKEEIEREDPDRIGAPDGSYQIGKPPNDWSYHQVASLQDLILELTGLRVPPEVTEKMPRVGSIVVFRYKEDAVVTPIFGKTKVNGRRIPLLLSTPARRGLQILTVPRRQPPFYAEHSLADSLISLTAQQVQSGAMSLTSIAPGKLPKTNRDMVIAQLEILFEDVFINGKEVPSLASVTTISAIKGDIFDYIISASNLRIGPGKDLEADQVEADLGEIFKTFRPLAVVNPAKIERDDRERADAAFDKILEEGTEQFFDVQLSLALNRIGQLDLSSLAGVSTALDLLQPFRTFAREGLVKGEELPELWLAMDQAEHGDVQLFRSLLQEAVASVAAQSAGSSNTSQETTAVGALGAPTAA
jgi:hypothetical protein